MPVGNCLLCQRESELQHSHVLPAFVYRWLRESSGNGFLRSTAAPNRRTQDGEKRYWLCVDCEQRFGQLEKAFADRLFYPYLTRSGDQFRYVQWLMRFCTSVSWRVAQFYLQGNHLAAWEPTQLQRLRAAEAAWRDYLIGARRRPGEYEQHLLPLDRIESSTAPLVPYINRYLMRAVQLDVCRGAQSILTFAKLGRFIIVGFIHEPERHRWKGARVHPAQGVIRPRRYEIPAGLYHYLMEKALKSHRALASVSDRQQERIATAFRANLDRFAGSDAFVAMSADVEMFGDAAFTRRE